MIKPIMKIININMISKRVDPPNSYLIEIKMSLNNKYNPINIKTKIMMQTVNVKIDPIVIFKIPPIKK